MWEEGINTKPQIYYNNNNAGTPQASKRKKKAIQIEKWKTHTILVVANLCNLRYCANNFVCTVLLIYKPNFAEN